MGSLPQIDLNSQASDYQIKNFQNLLEFLRKQSPLINFKLFDLTFTANGVQKIKHNLGFTPKDIIQTFILGGGDVEYRYENFTDTEFEFNITGGTSKDAPLNIRFLAGNYRMEVR